MKVDFIIAGVIKCGTTSMHSYLAGRDGVNMSGVKETEFFSTDSIYPKGTSIYHAFWPVDVHDEPGLFGEASPQYSGSNSAVIAERIHAYNAKMKFIFMVCHPIERLISQWRHGHKRKHAEALPGLEATMADRQRRQVLTDRSRYSHAVDHYASVFSEEQVHVVFLEDMIAQDPQAITDLDRFLELPEPQQGRAFPLEHRKSSDHLTATPTAVTDPLIADLSSDTEAFLQRYGKATDYWNMTPGTIFSH